jgi:hypothetical protein
MRERESHDTNLSGGGGGEGRDSLYTVNFSKLKLKNVELNYDNELLKLTLLIFTLQYRQVFRIDKSNTKIFSRTVYCYRQMLSLDCYWMNQQQALMSI